MNDSSEKGWSLEGKNSVIKSKASFNSTKDVEQYALEVKRISKSFPGVKALQEVDMYLKKGEVLAVVGENGAGKSTLMKILAGIYQEDSGEIFVEGEQVLIENVQQASALGVALVHQELNVCDNLSVAGNVFLGREPVRNKIFKIIDREKINKETELIISEIGLKVDVTALVKDLSLGAQQLVEISKALSIDAKIVMFDEPTSSLSGAETKRLFKVIKELSKRGVSCIYISHRLGEVKDIADRVVVLRDGKVSGTLEKEEIDRDSMIRLMVGRDIEKMYEKDHFSTEDVRMELKNFVVPNQAHNPINLTVNKGEIVVLSGLVGAGRTELLESIFGINAPWGGQILMDGNEVNIEKPIDAVRNGIVLVPEDRKLNGLFVSMEVDNNIAIPGLSEHFSQKGFVKKKGIKEIAQKMVRVLDIRLSSINQIAESLSGGNQQKVVIAKWLSMNPKMILLDEPTRGIDVGAKAEIYKLLEEMASSGVAILVASSEMQEVLGIADRIIVMCEGRITGELDPLNSTEEDIMKLATEYENKTESVV